MIDKLKLVPTNESEREEGELCSDDEMLEDVSSGDNISTQITLYDEKDNVKCQTKRAFNNTREKRARLNEKWSSLKREMSLSEISDDEDSRGSRRKKYRRSRTVRRKKSPDVGNKQDKRNRSISNVTVKNTVTKHSSEKRPIKSANGSRKRKRKSFHKPLRSLSSNSIKITSSESENEVDYAVKRKLAEAVYIEKATTNNDLKVRIESMLKKATSGEDENKIKDSSPRLSSIHQIDTLNKQVVVENVPNILDNEKTSIVPISDSSDEEADVIRLRLLALQTKPKIVPAVSNKVLSENENRNIESDEDQETQLRIDALKSAILKKHIARQKRKLEIPKIIKRRTSSELSYSPSSPTSISSCGDNTSATENRPYSPSEPIDPITETHISVYSPTESIISVMVDETESHNTLRDRMTPVDMNIDNESNDEMDKSIEIHDSQESTELIETVVNKPVETYQPVKVVNVTHHDIKKDHPILGGWVPVSESQNINKKKKSKNIQSDLVQIISKSCKKNVKPNSGVFKKTLQPVENHANNNPVLGNPISFNVNKPIVCEQDKQIDAAEHKYAEENDIAEVDEDEDILRAMLLTNLSSKISKKTESENDNIKNIPVDKKIYKENKLVIRNQKAIVKKVITPPINEKIITNISKTVTSNKVINKNTITITPAVKIITDSEKRLLSMINKPVPKLVINIRASESDTDEENPFKSGHGKSDKVKLMNKVTQKENKEKLESVRNVSVPINNVTKEMFTTNTTKDNKIPSKIQKSPNQQNPEFEKSLDMFLKTARDKAKIQEKTVPFSPSPKIDTKAVHSLSKSRQQEYKLLLRKIHYLEKRNAAQKAFARTKQNIALARVKIKEKQSETSVKPIIPKPITAAAATAIIKNDKELPLIIINNDLCEEPNAHNVRNDDMFGDSVIVQNENSINVTIRNDLLLEDDKVIEVDDENTGTINVTFKNDLVQASDVNKNIPINSKETTNVINNKSMHSDNSIKQCIQEDVQREFIKAKPLQPNTQECIPKKFNIKDVPEAKRHEFLSEKEKKLVEERYTFAKYLEHMLNLISSAENEKDIQTELEKEVYELREKLAKAENKLLEQKIKTSSMYSKISEYRKEIGNGRKSCVTMSNVCNEIGIAVFGSLYRTPTDGLEVMKNKLQKLAHHTCRLRTNNKDKLSTDEDIHIIDISEEFPTDENSKDQSDKIKSIENNSPKITVDVLEDECISKESEMIKSKSSEIECNVLIRKHDVKSSESANTIRNLDKKAAEYHVPKYISPLLHMQSNSVLDPDVILCPYDLTGRCEDSSCKYQHIS